MAASYAQVVEVVRAYNSWLQLTHIPKLMFYGTPGALMTAPVVDWASQALKNISAVDLGQGIHFLQEDSPHVIGEELASWYRDL